MSRYHIVKFIIILIFSTNIFAKNNKISTDELIIRGIFYSEYGMHNASYAIFEELYSKYKIEDFLFKMAQSAILSDNQATNTIKALEKWEKTHPKSKLKVKEFLLTLYAKERDVKKSEQIADEILQISNSAFDYEMIAYIYMYNEKYDKAIELFKKAYEQNHKESLVITIANLLSNYKHDNKQAIQLLEMHRRINLSSSQEIFKLLISLYVKTNDIVGISQTYQALYDINPKDEYLAKIIEAYIYQSDFRGAIKFLESHHIDDNILYDLYHHEEMYKKAFDFASKMYQKTHDPSWLAKKAIVVYEGATDKKDPKMIKEIISYFDKAIKEGVDDSSYYNYYGYTLIENDVDIKKGIEYIKKALAQQPDNAYYLDSLAWGYYKIHQCKKAYKLIKQISPKEIEETIEIKEHFEAIKKCK